MTLKKLVLEREIINKQIDELLTEIVALEELVEVMLTLNLNKEKAIEYMLLQAQEASCFIAS